MAGSNKKLKPWGNERQKNENLGVFVLPHKSFSFGSIFITGTPNMEGKVLLRTDPSKTLPWEIFFCENIAYLDFETFYLIIIILIYDIVGNYVEIYFYLLFQEKIFTLKLAFGAWRTQINISALCIVYQTKY